MAPRSRRETINNWTNSRQKKEKAIQGSDVCDGSDRSTQTAVANGTIRVDLKRRETRTNLCFMRIDMNTFDSD